MSIGCSKKKTKKNKKKNKSYRIINLITSIRLEVEYEGTKFVSLDDTKIKNKIRKLTKQTDYPGISQGKQDTEGIHRKIQGRNIKMVMKN